MRALAVDRPHCEPTRPGNTSPQVCRARRCRLRPAGCAGAGESYAALRRAVRGRPSRLGRSVGSFYTPAGVRSFGTLSFPSWAIRGEFLYASRREVIRDRQPHAPEDVPRFLYASRREVIRDHHVRAPGSARRIDVSIRQSASGHWGPFNRYAASRAYVASFYTPVGVRSFGTASAWWSRGRKTSFYTPVGVRSFGTVT